MEGKSIQVVADLLDASLVDRRIMLKLAEAFPKFQNVVFPVTPEDISAMFEMGCLTLYQTAVKRQKIIAVELSDLRLAVEHNHDNMASWALKNLKLSHPGASSSDFSKDAQGTYVFADIWSRSSALWSDQRPKDFVDFFDRTFNAFEELVDRYGKARIVQFDAENNYHIAAVVYYDDKRDAMDLVNAEPKRGPYAAFEINLAFSRETLVYLAEAPGCFTIRIWIDVSESPLGVIFINLENWARRFGSCEVTKLEYTRAEKVVDAVVCYKDPRDAEDAENAVSEVSSKTFHEKATKVAVLR